MKKDYSNSDWINAYLEGSLSPEQAFEFESQLANDPLLKHDFMREKDLIRNIQSYRKQQLKSQLGQVNISLAKIKLYNTLKITGALTVATLIGFGTFFYLQQDEQAKQATTETIVETLPLSHEPAEKLTTTQDQPVAAIEENKPLTNEVDASSVTVKESAEDRMVAEKTPEVNVPVERKNPVNLPSVNRPELTEQYEDKTELSLGDQAEFETDNLAGQPIENKSLTINTLNDTKYDFHYQLSSGSLILYGDFSKDTYEIIELIETDNRKVYLYYQGDFYLLKMEKDHILPLEVIENKKLINTLHNIQNNKML